MSGATREELARARKIGRIVAVLQSQGASAAQADGISHDPKARAAVEYLGGVANAASPRTWMQVVAVLEGMAGAHFDGRMT